MVVDVIGWVVDGLGVVEVVVKVNVSGAGLGFVVGDMAPVVVVVEVVGAMLGDGPLGPVVVVEVVVKVKV